MIFYALSLKECPTQENHLSERNVITIGSKTVKTE